MSPPQPLLFPPVRTFLLVSLVALAAAHPLPFSAQAAAQSTSTTTFGAVADTYASSSEPDRNFGTSSQFRTDGSPDVRSFLRFDPDGLSGSVSQATLRVFANSANSTGIDVRGVTSNSWGETTLTYRNKPGVLSVTDSSGRITAATWVEWDVTPLVTSNDPVSLALTSTSTTATSLASRESANKPQLVVTFGGSLPPPPPPPPPPTPPPPPPPPPGPGEGTIVAAAGDIACDPASESFNGGNGTTSNCRQRYTADLLTGAAVVLPLGDTQYNEGTPTQFRQSYDLSWGRFKAITRPAVGNHEYLTPGASGYYDYFGAAAGSRTEGWYSFDVGGWHLVALNSNCSEVGGCGVGSRQYEWLRADLAASSATCTLAYWHHPRFAYGSTYTSNAAYQPFWQLLYDDRAEIVLVGHVHNYQRYAPQTPTGARDDARGIRQFIVGSGGRDLHPVPSSGTNRQAANSDTFGVLKLTLRPTSYDWRFTPEAGKTYSDSGTTSCH